MFSRLIISVQKTSEGKHMYNICEFDVVKKNEIYINQNLRTKRKSDRGWHLQHICNFYSNHFSELYLFPDFKDHLPSNFLKSPSTIEKWSSRLLA